MIVVIVVLILAILVSIYQAKIKGYLGEKAVAAVLSGLPKDQYKLMNDVMLKTEYGTTQVDHILLSVYGIFVIETKNYKGWITGGEFSEKWTKNVYGKKYSFRNPLKQNYAHVKALEQVLELPKDKFIPIVAFSSNATIKVVSKSPVIYIGQLKRVVKNYTNRMFSEEELQAVESKILSSNIIDKDSRKQHVQQIKTKVKTDDAKVKAGVCPKCGGQLINRKGRYGSFLGCSNYPNCRYTKN